MFEMSHQTTIFLPDSVISVCRLKKGRKELQTGGFATLHRLPAILSPLLFVVCYFLMTELLIFRVPE